jgi:hypothetical protein
VPDVDATILSLSTDETLPILHVVAQAPSTETARKLSGATIVAVRRYLGSVAASQHIPAANQLVVRQFGAPVAQTATRGLPRRYALIATIVLAVLGCGAIIGGSWFARSWRQIEEAEARGHAADGKESEADLAEPVRMEPSAGAARGPGQIPRAVADRGDLAHRTP